MTQHDVCVCAGCAAGRLHHHSLGVVWGSLTQLRITSRRWTTTCVRRGKQHTTHSLHTGTQHTRHAVSRQQKCCSCFASHALVTCCVGLSFAGLTVQLLASLGPHIEVPTGPLTSHPCPACLPACCVFCTSRAACGDPLELLPHQRRRLSSRCPPGSTSRMEVSTPQQTPLVSAWQCWGPAWRQAVVRACWLLECSSPVLKPLTGHGPARLSAVTCPATAPVRSSLQRIAFCPAVLCCPQAPQVAPWPLALHPQ
jgi:hypothetical protein